MEDIAKVVTEIRAAIGEVCTCTSVKGQLLCNGYVFNV